MTDTVRQILENRIRLSDVRLVQRLATANQVAAPDTGSASRLHIGGGVTDEDRFSDIDRQLLDRLPQHACTRFPAIAVDAEAWDCGVGQMGAIEYRVGGGACRRELPSHVRSQPLVVFF